MKVGCNGESLWKWLIEHYLFTREMKKGKWWKLSDEETNKKYFKYFFLSIRLISANLDTNSWPRTTEAIEPVWPDREIICTIFGLLQQTKFCPISKYCQSWYIVHFYKYSNKASKFCQSGEISPNLANCSNFCSNKTSEKWLLQ